MKTDVDLDALGRNDPELQSAIIEIFGLRPTPEMVFQMADDLIYFSIAGADEFARTKGYKSGLTHMGVELDHLRVNVEQKDLLNVIVFIAENRIQFRWPGRLFSNSGSGQRVWHAGWDDFITWRKERSLNRTQFSEQNPEVNIA